MKLSLHLKKCRPYLPDSSVSKQPDKVYVDKILSRKPSHQGSQKENYLKLARLEITLMQSVHRLYFFARGIAKVVLPQEMMG